jgi:hypothetical protein
MSELRKRTLNPPVSPIAVLFRHLHNQILNVAGRAGRPEPRLLLPSYFSAMRLRCQRD